MATHLCDRCDGNVPILERNMYFKEVWINIKRIIVQNPPKPHERFKDQASMPLQESNQHSKPGSQDKWQYRHAIPAACDVEMNPQIIALDPIRAIRRVREGARVKNTPI